VSMGVTAQREWSGGSLAPPTLMGLLLSAALVPLGSTAIAVALGDVARDFAAEPAALTQWLVNSYLVVGVVLQSPAGKLCDRWGLRRALAAGQVLFAAGALLGAVSGTLALLVGARVLMAAGGALLVPGTMAALRSATEPSGRARLFGVAGAAMGLAAALGPLLGGVLTDTFGWRAIFLVNVPLLAGAAPLLRRLPAGPPRHRGAHFDWRGSALLACGLGLAVWGSRATGVPAAALLALGAGALFCFVMVERRAPDPVVDLALFRSQPFAAGVLVIALHNCVMYALIFQLPFFFRSALGSGATESGRMLLMMMLSMVACSPLGGQAAERFGARAVATLGTFILLSGLLLLSRIGGFHHPLDAVPALLLIGAGLGLATPAAQAAALGSIPDARSGMAAGALSSVRYLGGVVGIVTLGLLLGDGSAADAFASLHAHERVILLHCTVAALALAAAAGLPPLDSPVAVGAAAASHRTNASAPPGRRGSTVACTLPDS
jgi:MFS family permease